MAERKSTKAKNRQSFWKKV